MYIHIDVIDGNGSKKGGPTNSSSSLTWTPVPLAAGVTVRMLCSSRNVLPQVRNYQPRSCVIRTAPIQDPESTDEMEAQDHALARSLAIGSNSHN